MLSRAVTPAEARDHGLIMAAVCTAGRVSPAALSSADPDGGGGLWRRLERRDARAGVEKTGSRDSGGTDARGSGWGGEGEARKAGRTERERGRVGGQSL